MNLHFAPTSAVYFQQLLLIHLPSEKYIIFQQIREDESINRVDGHCNGAARRLQSLGSSGFFHHPFLRSGRHPWLPPPPLAHPEIPASHALLLLRIVLFSHGCVFAFIFVRFMLFFFNRTSHDFHCFLLLHSLTFFIIIILIRRIYRHLRKYNRTEDLQQQREATYASQHACYESGYV